jgi:hypothetical protein
VTFQRWAGSTKSTYYIPSMLRLKQGSHSRTHRTQLSHQLASSMSHAQAGHCELTWARFCATRSSETRHRLLQLRPAFKSGSTTSPVPPRQVKAALCGRVLCCQSATLSDLDQRFRLTWFRLLRAECRLDCRREELPQDESESPTYSKF